MNIHININMYIYVCVCQETLVQSLGWEDPLEESTVHATSLNIIKLKHRETVKISRAMLIMPEFFFK